MSEALGTASCYYFARQTEAMALPSQARSSMSVWLLLDAWEPGYVWIPNVRPSLKLPMQPLLIAGHAGWATAAGLMTLFNEKTHVAMICGVLAFGAIAGGEEDSETKENEVDDLTRMTVAKASALSPP